MIPADNELEIKWIFEQYARVLTLLQTPPSISVRPQEVIQREMSELFREYATFLRQRAAGGEHQQQATLQWEENNLLARRQQLQRESSARSSPPPGASQRLTSHQLRWRVQDVLRVAAPLHSFQSPHAFMRLMQEVFTREKLTGALGFPCTFVDMFIVAEEVFKHAFPQVSQSILKEFKELKDIAQMFDPTETPPPYLQAAIIPSAVGILGFALTVYGLRLMEPSHLLTSPIQPLPMFFGNVFMMASCGLFMAMGKTLLGLEKNIFLKTKWEKILNFFGPYTVNSIQEQQISHFRQELYREWTQANGDAPNQNLIGRMNRNPDTFMNSFLFFCGTFLFLPLGLGAPHVAGAGVLTAAAAGHAWRSGAPTVGVQKIAYFLACSSVYVATYYWMYNSPMLKNFLQEDTYCNKSALSQYYQLDNNPMYFKDYYRFKNDRTRYLENDPQRELERIITDTGGPPKGCLEGYFQHNVAAVTAFAAMWGAERLARKLNSFVGKTPRLAGDFYRWFQTFKEVSDEMWDDLGAPL